MPAAPAVPNLARLPRQSLPLHTKAGLLNPCVLNPFALGWKSKKGQIACWKNR